MIYKLYLSFTRRKISFFVVPFIIISIIFILYQLNIFMQISKEYKILTPKNKLPLIRGIHEQQAIFYMPDKNNNFVCIQSLEEITITKVNDNYCDCLDGSDEPGTNACNNGIFYCASQIVVGHYPKLIKSSKVNDGLCDCCDGSDEWENNILLKFNESLQRKANQYHPPCPVLC